jgi:hypothetical protein
MYLFLERDRKVAVFVKQNSVVSHHKGQTQDTDVFNGECLDSTSSNDDSGDRDNSSDSDCDNHCDNDNDCSEIGDTALLEVSESATKQEKEIAKLEEEEKGHPCVVLESVEEDVGKRGWNENERIDMITYSKGNIVDMNYSILKSIEIERSEIKIEKRDDRPWDGVAEYKENDDDKRNEIRNGVVDISFHKEEDVFNFKFKMKETDKELETNLMENERRLENPQDVVLEAIEVQRLIDEMLLSDISTDINH